MTARSDRTLEGSGPVWPAPLANLNPAWSWKRRSGNLDPRGFRWTPWARYLQSDGNRRIGRYFTVGRAGSPTRLVNQPRKRGADRHEASATKRPNPIRGSRFFPSALKRPNDRRRRTEVNPLQLDFLAERPCYERHERLWSVTAIQRFYGTTPETVNREMVADGRHFSPRFRRSFIGTSQARPPARMRIGFTPRRPGPVTVAKVTAVTRFPERKSSPPASTNHMTALNGMDGVPVRFLPRGRKFIGVAARSDLP